VIASGRRVVIPEITDYEVRRLLLKRGASAQVRQLDELGDEFYYSPLNTELMREAAHVWAEAENSGHRFGHPKTLNADAILVAQTQAMGEDVTVITKNVRHLAPFVEAVWWTHFAP
jgi:predicted nucleic acid-binding protein